MRAGTTLTKLQGHLGRRPKGKFGVVSAGSRCSTILFLHPEGDLVIHSQLHYSTCHLKVHTPGTQHGMLNA